ncbi:acyl carrier protein [Kitasatospora aureofaciens]|uniref:acyl carrier protein n=1 Tax=Kitasatospora aureofaciens TaxID=1894 RepID=UPI001C489D4F|nr:acyl carrier protein [Kitasatospora aureofaciens]MBV6698888.1 acyl carrier protein [Kitasatospora aureofaciens]
MTQTVTEMIIEILTTKYEVPAEELSSEVVFEELSVDSLTLLEMSLILEKRLGVSIQEGVLDAGQTVGEAAETISSLGAAA